jgi:hypothetical protein
MVRGPALSPTSEATRLGALKTGLQDLGYIEKKTFWLGIDMLKESQTACPRSRTPQTQKMNFGFWLEETKR